MEPDSEKLYWSLSRTSSQTFIGLHRRSYSPHVFLCLASHGLSCCYHIQFSQMSCPVSLFIEISTQRNVSNESLILWFVCFADQRSHQLSNIRSLHTVSLISSKLSLQIFIARFYSRWLVQYLCRLWGSHPGPVHTQGLSRPLLACRLSQGNDGGSGDDQTNPDCCVVVFWVWNAAGRDPHLLCQRWENFL